MAPNRYPSGPLPSTTPLADLPITSFHCMNDTCDAFAAGWNESYRETSLISQLNYGYWTLCYYLSWLLIFTLANLVYIIRGYRAQRQTKRDPPSRGPSWANRLVARYRAIAYRRFTGRLVALPSYGALAFLVLSTVFMICLVFPEQEYIRSHFRFGSPPLSVRCALCISALMPLLIALGGKVNLVTVLTGVCYTKLNILHRYVGGVIFALATIHTVPHLYAPIKDGGVAYLAQLYIDQKRELSGTILYFLFLILMSLSLPPIRRRFYEFFAYTHIFLGLAFIGILAWHIAGEYLAPTYLYLTLSLLLTQPLLRLVCSPSFTTHPATLTPLPGHTTRVRIPVPAALRWAPGAHAYLRVPALEWLGNHPFTVASVPTATAEAETGEREKGNEMVFLVRAQRGFTRKLAEAAKKGEPKASRPPSPEDAGDAASTTSSSAATEVAEAATATGKTYRTLVSMPHAAASSAPRFHAIAATIDTVILVAGGTGITSAVAWATGLSRAMAAGKSRVSCVRLFWMVRGADCVSWVREELEAAAGVAGVGVEVWVTGKAASEEDGEVAGPEKGGVRVRFGRPDVRAEVRGALEGRGGRAFVLGCGSERVGAEVGNAVAGCQAEVVRGGVESLVGCVEGFGW